MSGKRPMGHFAYTNYHIDYRFTNPLDRVGALSRRLLFRCGLPFCFRGWWLVMLKRRRRWSTSEPALRRHEMGHAAVAVAAAEEIELAPLDITGQPSCPAAGLLTKKRPTASSPTLGIGTNPMIAKLIREAPKARFSRWRVALKR